MFFCFIFCFLQQCVIILLSFKKGILLWKRDEDTMLFDSYPESNAHFHQHQVVKMTQYCTTNAQHEAQSVSLHVPNQQSTFLCFFGTLSPSQNRLIQAQKMHNVPSGASMSTVHHLTTHNLSPSGLKILLQGINRIIKLK